MNDLEILIIQHYVEKYLPEPDISMVCPGGKDLYYFVEERSIRRYTADEIIGWLLRNPFANTETVIESFIILLEFYLCVAKGTKKERVFKIMRDTADDILCLFL